MGKANPDLICPLCGKNKVEYDHKKGKYISREHVPPQCIFIGNIPDNLITVPSCKDCNYGTHTADEEFKCILSLRLGTGTPQKKELFDSTRKTLNKKPRLRNGYINNASSLVLPYGNRANLFGHLMRVNGMPVRKIVTKIIKGLHWYVTKEMIPSNNQPDIYTIRQGFSVDSTIMSIFNKYGKSIKKGNQFETIYCVAENKTLWLIRFYGEDCFVCSSISPQVNGIL